MLTIDLLEPVFDHKHLLLAVVVLIVEEFAVSDGLGVGVLELEALNLGLGFGVDDLQFAVSELLHEIGFKGVVLRSAEAPLLLVFGITV